MCDVCVLQRQAGARHAAILEEAARQRATYRATAHPTRPGAEPTTSRRLETLRGLLSRFASPGMAPALRD